MTDLSHAPETPEMRTERLIDGLLRGIFVIRIPLAMGVLSVLVLTLSDQVLEVHRVLTQERAQDAFNVHWLLALASLVALSLVLWQMARQHAEYAAEDVPGEHVVSHPLCTWVLRWGPRLVATLPLLGAALGIWLSRLPNLDGADMPALPGRSLEDHRPAQEGLRHWQPASASPWRLSSSSSSPCSSAV